MAIRISFVFLIIAIFLLAETLVSGAPGPEASHLSEFLPASHAH